MSTSPKVDNQTAETSATTSPSQQTKSPNKVYTLGIRREDKNRWERRAPLAPSHVEALVKAGIKIIVQPSTLRTYPNQSYSKAGAVIQEDLKECDVIIAVKEVPSEYLYPGKTYIFFSHTIKAQPYNMPMLDEINKKHIRLIDYERITDSQNKRLVRFGSFAGYAGMIDMLHALGDRLLAKGFSTPFLHIGYSYVYPKLESAREAVKSIGEEISQVGLPDDLLPFTFAFTSEGSVSQGALDIFKLLPHKMVTPDEMVDLVKNKKGERGILYGTIITSEHMVEPIDPTKKFNKAEYYKDPSAYKPIFFEKYAPYISCIINCMYWDAKYPRLITIRQMEQLVETNNSRLIGVADISADINGSLEFLMKTTSIDLPLYIYDPKTQDVHDSTTDQKYMYRDGILFLAVDNLPTEFPREATQWFGDHLLPFMEKVVKSDPNKPYDQMDDIPLEIKRACITSHGQLTPPFEYIKELRKKREAMIGKILILGAGYLSLPTIEYLSRNPSHSITVADVNVDILSKASKFENDITTVILDVNDQDKLDKLVGKNDVVISMLPNELSVMVAKSCIKMKTHFVNPNYMTEEMEELHQQALDAGITLLNEMGLDPGVDHLEASRVIDEVKQSGGHIRTFVSWCGGLPAPESSDNPIGYKFSWSPKGVLSAVTKDAEFRRDGKDILITGDQLYKKGVQTVDIFPALQLEGVPNRSCLNLQKVYDIPTVNTLFRGTIRYKGFCQVIEAAVEIGLFDDSDVDILKPDSPKISWNTALRTLLPENNKSKSTTEEYSTQELLRRKLRTRRGSPYKGYDDDKITSILHVFEWLGLFSKENFIAQTGSFFESFCELLKCKLEFQPSERDLIILHNIVGIDWDDGRHETRTSTLVYYGDSTISAVATTIGLPVAIAAELLVEKSVVERGVVRPTKPEYYKPILKALSNEGIKFIHSSEFDKHH
ncbi:aminoadipic semialdehyde synthase [Tieghemostelium lacteum]|uniref:Aminoadipic semialdehyde synthase n=1 Tax=Tieghemostelium lacteum TaxID=361077 RepID=A0A151ZSM8_TIELA|nr:aminoadipic semialdehyde synthase [Tieghemostelium lacteum]|eukprot:KYQ96940.1 aminoadipic semialdehyde synthase [Tieghemostelium lacteum]